MAAPRVTNLRPDDGDTDVTLATPFRFGVRDFDTRADLASVYCAATYARADYVPAADLPGVDPVLAAAGAAVIFSTFNDAAGVVAPGDPCAQSLETVGPDTVYRIEKAGLDDVLQEGFLYVTVPAQDAPQPYMVTAEIDLASVIADPDYAYTTANDFVGVVLGFVYWPENTGVFLLFRDDGTKRITVAGPSADGVGTRPVSTSVVYDWSSTATYSVHVDPTAHSRLARVLATSSTGVEVLLAEVDLDALNEFLPSVRMGNRYVENGPAQFVTMVLGIDGTDQGNYVDVLRFSLANFGRVLVSRGSRTGASTVEALPTEVVRLVGSEGADEWAASGVFLTETMETELVIQAAAGGPALYRRDEPDLAHGEWLVVGRVSAENAVHLGTYDTGMGLLVEDGTRQHRLSFLDDFSTNTVGVADTAGADAVLTGYRLPTDDVDWEAGVAFTLLGSTSRAALRLFVDEDPVPVLDLAYAAAGYGVTTASRISFGMLSSGAATGDFSLAYLWVFPVCSFYEGADATYPDAQGWTRTSALGTRALADEAVDIDCRAPGAYDIYSVTDATYDETSGVATLFWALVSGWTDAAGAVNPPRTEFGPVASLRTSTVSAQVRFVVADDGTAYVFLSNEASDCAEVLAQSAAGRAISAEVDLAVAHTYLLDVKPMHHVRLYLDYATEPAIEVAWPASGALRALPTNVPPSATLAWGSLDENAGVACTVGFFRGGVGRGYDFKAELAVDEADLQDRVYGSRAHLLIDFLDED